MQNEDTNKAEKHDESPSSEITVIRRLSDTGCICEITHSIQTLPSQNEMKQTKFEENMYLGSSNAFCIQLFCINEKYETRSIDFLAKAFELFPDREYCVISIPFLVPEFPLLQSFARITPKISSTFSHELYVFHSSGLLKSFRVHPVCEADLSAITTLVASLQNSNAVIRDVEKFITLRKNEEGTELQAFTAKCLDQVGETTCIFMY